MHCRGPDDQSYKNFLCKKNCTYFIQDYQFRIYIKDQSTLYLQRLYLSIQWRIYNFKELKSKINNNFQTASDTEVILYYYNIYKEKCFEFFEGMWSIIIYDRKYKK